MEQLKQQLALPGCANYGATDRLLEIMGEARTMARAMWELNPLAMLRLHCHRLDRPLSALQDTAPAAFWDGVLVGPPVVLANVCAWQRFAA